MRKILIVLSVFLISSTGFHTFAQEKTQTPQTATQDTSERPKNSVDKMIEEARNRGEVVVGGCLQDCGDEANKENSVTAEIVALPPPTYPPIARAAHASGDVQVQVLVDVDGTVIAAAVISGHPLLQAASLQAARNARFSPVTYKGEPAKLAGVIVYHFVRQQ